MKNQKSSIDSIKKWNKILEKVWFWIAVVASVFSFVIAVVDNFQGVLTYFLLSGLAWGIYLVRRGIRIKLDKSSN
ncbi:MAG: hypothetical protein VXY47_04915 [Bacteroidota bacterium]|nr:hypothetical protein [Bacteroidota bacterium]MEC8968602.1 hypothetical protein [Bacteroidota bacterium]|tara:strand:- start:745 stop:969 length:225 start_codon:yes stop_codon:yes gene_type:complete